MTIDEYAQAKMLRAHPHLHFGCAAQPIGLELIIKIDEILLLPYKNRIRLWRHCV